MRVKKTATLAAGAILCLFIGLIYAWSIFVAPLEAEFGWTRTQTSATFTVSMISFCLAGMVSGTWIKKRSPRLIVLAAAALFLIGFAASSRVATVRGLYVGYGVFCGAGVGLTYNAVISSVTRWFPGKTGIISGVLLMCFGFGGMVLGSLASVLIVLMGWRTTFLVFAVLFAAIPAVFSLWIRFPREGELDSDNPRVLFKPAVKEGAFGAEMVTSQMIRRPSFWLYFLWAAVLSAAGLAIMGNAAMCAQEVGATTAAAAAITGTLSVCSGIGRVVSGLVFDRFGRRSCSACANTLMALAMLIIVIASRIHSIALFTVGGVILGFGYGSVPPLNAAFVNQFYGSRNYALNFGVMNLNLIPASILGPLVAGAIQTATGSYYPMYLALLMTSVVIYLAQLLIKKP